MSLHAIMLNKRPSHSYVNPSWIVKFITFLLILAGGSLAAADACDVVLQMSSYNLNLPRSLRISPESIEHLLETPDHARLLEALSRVFSALDEEQMSQIGKILNVDFAGETPDLRAHAFFKLRPDLITPSVGRNYALLSESEVAQKLDADDLALLAYLLKDITRIPGLTGVDAMVLGNTLDSYLPRLRLILHDTNYRLIIADLLNSARVRGLFLGVSQKVEGQRIGIKAILESKLEVMTNNVARGDIAASTSKWLLLYLHSFSIAAAREGVESEQEFMGRQGKPPHWIDREPYFAALESSMVKKAQMQNSLDSIVALLDFIFFQTPLPASSARIYRALIDSSKALLLPLKTKANEFTVEQRRLAARQAEERPRPAFVFRFAEEPIAVAPFIRVRTSEARPETKPAGEGDRSPPNSLRDFTSFVDAPRDLHALVPGQLYGFWFLRNNSMKPQSVQFGPDALVWFRANPEFGRRFIDALHFGHARSNGQSGIKVLRGRSPLHDGLVFEVKISGTGLRGLALYVSGQWQLLDVVKKDGLDRAIMSAHSL